MNEKPTQLLTWQQVENVLKGIPYIASKLSKRGGSKAKLGVDHRGNQLNLHRFLGILNRHGGDLNWTICCGPSTWSTFTLH